MGFFEELSFIANIYIWPIIVFLVNLAMLVWIYRDAKNYNTYPILWVLAAVILNFPLGLILYLLYGRKDPKVVCRHCHNKQSSDLEYCANCGAEMDNREYYA
ncbi:putative membrane protein [Peptoniphilus sp. ING2-D1G]|nr:putative membrane protein [Peptoniphilus sp. ING2-D1G]